MTTRMMETYKRWPVTFESGRGARLIADDGRSFIDMVGGIAVCSVGHCHPRVVAAAMEQAQKLIHVSNLYGTKPQSELAERLFDLTGMTSFFCNSGAEAVECAIKLARRWGGEHGRRSKIVAAEGSFHGRTFGALAATGQRAKQEAFDPMLPGFVHVPFGDTSSLAAAIDDHTAAVLLEPILGETGVIVPPQGFLGEVRRLCDEAGVLLILDEIQTGLGRTGRWFACETESVTPDILCLAKALGGGFPIGACLARPEVAATFRPGDHGTTFGGNPVVCAAASATLQVIAEEGLLEQALYIESTVRNRLPQDAVRGRGALLGIEVGADAAEKLALAAFDRGVLLNVVTDSAIRLCPPLVIRDEDLGEVLNLIEEVAYAAATS
ncbi:MAG: acetylornithine transaminase [Actinobacteria bacterium]|nr:acetylornithine transaminase [Actinomycetota bacterium]